MVFQSSIATVEPPREFGDSLSAFFWSQLDKFAAKTLIVDYETGRQWTGERIKATAGTIARNLQTGLGLQPADSAVLFYPNCDHLQLAALAVLFCGASVCAGAPEDPETEHEYMVELMQPRVVFASAELVAELLAIRSRLGLAYTIVLLDDDDGGADDRAPGKRLLTSLAPDAPVRGLHSHLLGAPGAGAADEFAPSPIADPKWPAFVLLTSGSTGRPKPVSRSHANSLNVCFTLDGAEHLWHLHERSVLAGHLQLDHGTGLFCLKMTLAKGLTLVVMHGYEPQKMLAAIERHRISDVLLGSAFVHNDFVCKPDELRRRDIRSLRNLLAVGSPLASHELARDFMRQFPEISVRQAFGMTECGFLSIVQRDQAAHDADSVGQVLPNFRLKLLDRASQREITDFDREGELYVASVKVSPGYLGARFAEQTRAAFNQLGANYYKTNDICSVGRDGRLRIRGRYSEVLCLHDGWKVLPFEIEQTLLRHPRVREVAVVGVPHPELPTCHAPRAYVVLEDPPRANGAAPANGDRQRNGAAAAAAGPSIEAELFEFAAGQLSEPKHLVGGIKIVAELPRISIGKVDKKLLKQMDGYS